MALTTSAVADGPRVASAVEVWFTANDGSKRLVRDVALVEGAAAEDVLIRVAPTLRHQEMLGFGCTLIDDSIESMQPAARERVLRDLFSVEEGAGLSYLRVTIGTVDHKPATYLDLPPGQTDWALSGFSIDADRTGRLPVALAAKRISPQIQFVGTPWSPPGWMKTTGRINGGWLLPGERTKDAYVRYLLKWLEAWREEGVPLSAITIANEPQNFGSQWPILSMSYSEQSDIIARLGRALKETPDREVAIWGWDQSFGQNDDERGGLAGILADEDANPHIEGVAWHGYNGSPAFMEEIQRQFPGKSMYFTEMTGTYSENWRGTPDFKGFNGTVLWHFINTFEATIRRNARVVMMWKLALRLGDHELRGDRPLVRIMPDGVSYELNGEYYLLAHFAKFVRPGARRIESNSSGDVHTLAFINRDGGVVLVAANNSKLPRAMAVQCEERSFSYTLQGMGLATFVWR